MANDLIHKFDFLASAIAVLGFLANAFLLFVVIKTKKIRENATNYFIIASLIINLIFVVWSAFSLVR